MAKFSSTCIIQRKNIEKAQVLLSEAKLRPGDISMLRWGVRRGLCATYAACLRGMLNVTRGKVRQTFTWRLFS